jgi:hypothetical protein
MAIVFEVYNAIFISAKGMQEIIFGRRTWVKMHTNKFMKQKHEYRQRQILVDYEQLRWGH